MKNSRRLFHNDFITKRRLQSANNNSKKIIGTKAIISAALGDEEILRAFRAIKQSLEFHVASTWFLYRVTCIIFFLWCQFLAGFSAVVSFNEITEIAYTVSSWNQLFKQTGELEEKY